MNNQLHIILPEGHCIVSFMGNFALALHYEAVPSEGTRIIAGNYRLHDTCIMVDDLSPFDILKKGTM